MLDMVLALTMPFPNHPDPTLDSGAELGWTSPFELLESVARMENGNGE